MSAQDKSTQKAIEIAAPVINMVNDLDREKSTTTWFDKTVEFTKDKIVVTVTEELINEKTDVSIEKLINLQDVETKERKTNTILTITFTLWMATRRAKRSEFEAIKQGVTEKQNKKERDIDDLTPLEKRYYLRGRDETTEESDKDPEHVLGGRIPDVIEYHRTSGYDGPKQHSHAFDYDGQTNFSPQDAGRIITEVNEIHRMNTHDYPSIECEDENGTVHTFSYWIED